MKARILLVALAAAVIMTSCEKPAFSEEEAGSDVPGTTNVTLRFIPYELEDFTRTATDITEICSCINLAFFDAEGTKVKTVTQKEGDTDYGTVKLALSEGIYHLVVIAHNCDGAATISSPEKVTFPNNKVTDTFYFYGDLAVTAEPQAHDLSLTRAVAMFRLVMTDQNIPENVTRFKFYYTGGSSTFSPALGYGCVNSRQTEYRDVTEDGIYEIYTLPHEERDLLTKITVTALDASDQTVTERAFGDVPVTRNQVTRFTGSFFGEGGGGGGGSPVSSSIRLTANPEWDSESTYNF